MAVYPAIFAAIYNPILLSGEVAGMTKRRRALLSEAHGAVLEIGAGTGLNLKHYPAAVTDLTLTEPDASMFRRLTKAAGHRQPTPRLMQAGAETLPFDDDSFDTVVSTLVLCTVGDVAATLAEIRRVLRPGGHLLLIEHVESESARLSGAQNRLHRPWKAFACNCNCNLRTRDLLEAAGFAAAGLRAEKWGMMPPLVRPLIVGSLAAPA